MKIRSTLAYSLAFSFMGAPLLVGAGVLMSPTPVVAQAATLNLAGEGEGTLAIGNRPNQTVTFVAISSRPNRQTDISWRLADGNLLQWNGQLISASATQAQIRLTSAGMADATGTLTVRYQGNRLISVMGSGTIDGQAMSIRFTIGDDSVSRPPTTGTPRNLAQAGHGIFGLQGRPNRPITFALVSVQPNGQAELSVRMADGTLITFGGQQTRNNAYELVLNLSNAGVADAQGTANIRHGANNSIKNIVANGSMDGQSFFIQFTGH